jgi:hypothetical protein
MSTTPTTTKPTLYVCVLRTRKEAVVDVRIEVFMSDQKKKKRKDQR